MAGSASKRSRLPRRAGSKGRSVEHLRAILDPAFYLAKYPDIATTGLDPFEHYARHGLGEGRNPNPFFDGAWYRAQNPDVARSGIDPLLHYLTTGAAELRNPHPRFDAAFYTEQHPQAATNPLMFHLLAGRARGFATEPEFDPAAFLPSRGETPRPPPGLRVDVVIPCYRGLAETQRCIESVLADPDRLPGRIIVVDDASPERALSSWLDRMAVSGRVEVLRNTRNLGFVASANRGMAAAAPADVVLLNSDTEVPAGWLARLAGHAYAGPRIASVSPWSNNATICSYPSMGGGPPVSGLSLQAIDAAAHAANAGRRVRVPVTVGFCMYIRRAALNEVGAFDEAAFGRGYGEECDFCLRAATRGWEHALACDIYVHHQAEVSFGARARKARIAAQDVLSERWPDFTRQVERHVLRGAAEPYRFALTAELYRRAGLPVILCVTHQLGGGIDGHIERLAARLRGRANLLSLRPSARGIAISAPSLPEHGVATIPVDRIDAVVQALTSAGVTRVHVHQVMGIDFDLRRIIRQLDVPFDLTVHDWFLICPQVNLLPQLDGQYCSEPDQAGCNACIAARPANDALEILDWRARHGWLLREAARILCPSEDARARIARHGWGERAIHAPHEPAFAGAWQVARPRLKANEPLRVAVLGVLAAQKGAATVKALAEATDPKRVALHLVGYPERVLPRHLRGRIKATGPYADADLPALIARIDPHVVWFPAQWPETWSYTLSAALAAARPVVATHIGAFPERVQERPLTWLVDPDAPTAAWVAAFEAVRAALRRTKTPSPPAIAGGEGGVRGAQRTALTRHASRGDLSRGAGEVNVGPDDFYPDAYLAPLAASLAAPAIARDLRRRDRVSVVVVPERFDTTLVPTPCAYIRLLQPLTHPLAAAGLDVTIASLDEAMDLRADILATHRHAVTDVALAERLVRHCRQHDMALLYDLDDDLLHVPPGHADAASLRSGAAAVRRLLREADAVWVSTPGLAQRLAAVRPNTVIVPNGLDDRLWFPNGPPPTGRRRGEPVRVLFMGTMTHDDDLTLVEPALGRLRKEFGGRVAFDVVGVSARLDLPHWINRVSPDHVATQSYPGFVDWIIRAPAWDIGIAPLGHTPFNAAKSPIKTLDYAALGLPTVASDVPAYRGSLADGRGGLLVANDPASWADALDRLIRMQRLRRELAEGARSGLLASGTLAAQAEGRLAALLALAPRRAAPSPGARRAPTSPASGRGGRARGDNDLSFKEVTEAG